MGSNTGIAVMNSNANQRLSESVLFSTKLVKLSREIFHT